MKSFLFGVVVGAVLMTAPTIAQEAFDMGQGDTMPRVIVPFGGTFGGGYPPSWNSLPPMPSPHWQSVRPPC